jgi:DNA-binding transcriptional LysR family regulator
MEWDELRYVLATARSGSFLNASRLLGVSHTTVGRRIKSLEGDLGLVLFLRTREGCKPTEAALRLLPLAERVEKEMREVGRLAAGAMEEPEGNVAIHTANWILRTILAPAVPELLSMYPKLQVQFYGGVIEALTPANTSSIELRFSIMASRTQAEMAIADLNYSVFAPAGQEPDKTTWVSTYAGRVTLSTYEWLARSNKGAPAMSFLASDADLVAAAIAAGVGKGLIPDLLGQSDPRMSRVTRGGPAHVRTLRSLVPTRHSSKLEVRAVLGWIKQVIGQAALRQ